MDALCETHKTPVQKNGVCPKCYFRSWYEAHRAEVIERSKQWKLDHPDKALPSKRQWAKRHRSVIREAGRRFVARRRGNEVHPYKEGVVYQRDGWTCHLCGKPIDATLLVLSKESPTLDHLVPVSAGGADASWNVRPAHLSCNAKRQTGGLVQLLLPIEVPAA